MGAAIIVLLLLKINVNKEISCSGYFLHIDKLKKKKKQTNGKRKQNIVLIMWLSYNMKK